MWVCPGGVEKSRKVKRGQSPQSSKRARNSRADGVDVGEVNPPAGPDSEAGADKGRGNESVHKVLVDE